MKVMLTPRDSTVEICSKSFVVGEITENFIQKLNLEVRHNPKLAKKLLKNLTQTHTKLASMLVFAPTSYVVPKDITDPLHTAIIVLAILGIGIALITLMMSGIWKMLYGKSKADEWQVNIIKGLGTVLGAPIIIALMVGVFILLFSNIPAFQPLVSPIGAFLHGD